MQDQKPWIDEVLSQRNGCIQGWRETTMIERCLFSAWRRLFKNHVTQHHNLSQSHLLFIIPSHFLCFCNLCLPPILTPVDLIRYLLYVYNLKFRFFFCFCFWLSIVSGFLSFNEFDLSVYLSYKWCGISSARLISHVHHQQLSVYIENFDFTVNCMQRLISLVFIFWEVKIWNTRKLRSTCPWAATLRS